MQSINRQSPPSASHMSAWNSCLPSQHGQDQQTWSCQGVFTHLRAQELALMQRVDAAGHAEHAQHKSQDLVRRD